MTQALTRVPAQLTELQQQVEELRTEVRTLHSEAAASRPGGPAERRAWSILTILVGAAGLLLSAYPVAFPDRQDERGNVVLAVVGAVLLIGLVAALVGGRPLRLAAGILIVLVVVSTVNAVAATGTLGHVGRVSTFVQFLLFPVLIPIGFLVARPRIQLGLNSKPYPSWPFYLFLFAGAVNLAFHAAYWVTSGHWFEMINLGPR